MESFVEILSYIFWVVLAITILVFVHEMGHFLMAKLFKMRVDRFSIGFPPKIFGKKIGETEYVIGATPLGGYVKIAGMVDESMDTDFAQSEPEPHEFRAKPVWQRIIVITAGVIFNVILAAFIFMGLKLAYGETYIPAENIRHVYVEDGSLAHKMGLRTGDRIVAISGKELKEYGELESLEAFLSDPLTITVERGGAQHTFEGPKDIFTQLSRSRGLGISAVPALVGDVVSDGVAAEAGLQRGDRVAQIGGAGVQFWAQMTEAIQASKGAPVPVRWARPDSLAGSGSLTPVDTVDGFYVYQATLTPKEDGDRYVLGIYPPSDDMLAHEFGQKHRSYTAGAALSRGLSETWFNMKAVVTSLTRVFTGRENLRENVGGPIMIARATKQAAAAGMEQFWRLVALLSITLAIINILPIPALDGGHLMFLLYEGITRREPSLKVRMVMQQVGMILLLAFMTFLIFNDILRL
jgi:regulator of sigma E protease